MDIDTISKKFTAEYKIIAQLKEENSLLKDKITHLEELLASSIPILSNEIRVHVTKEQAACEMQIARLNESAKNRELTLEETKKLEILIKSLYLVKDKVKEPPLSESIPTSIEDLTKIATDG